MSELSPITQKFVLHWGEMGSRWGINRTVAQIHALLYLSEKPLNADEICETLSLARSNVSTSLKELQSWGIVRVVHTMGDRRDHFESMKDVWEMFRLILAERKKRELDPTLRVLRECVAESEKKGASDAHAAARLKEMSAFFDTAATAYEQFNRVPVKTLAKLAKMGDKVLGLLGGEK